jgi:hypothetical protein
MACERLEFPVLSFPSAPRDMPPDRELAAARALVEDWLGTTFLHRADAVEDLVVRIAAALSARELGGEFEERGEPR